MENIRKKLYIFSDVIIIVWSIIWLFVIAFLGVFTFKSLEDWLASSVFIIIWVLGLLPLLLARRFIKGKNDFQKVKIKKTPILIGAFLFAFLTAYLLGKGAYEFLNYYGFIFALVIISVLYVLFGKLIRKCTVCSNPYILRGNRRYCRIRQVSFITLFLIFIYLGSFESSLFNKKIFLVLIAFLPIGTFIVLALLVKNKIEFNCPHCSKLIRLNISGKFSESLDCNHCQNKIRINPYKGEEKYLFIIKKTKYKCPHCNNVMTLPRIIREPAVLCAHCGKIIQAARYIAVKDSESAPK